MPNRLASETSPYLLQHKDNPVDWFPWGEEAFERAKAEDKPIFLSVGYSACHWCHVMAHESFEDDETAALMNDLYINIKVDREERPDVDAIYMNAVQALTGSGGWPMSVWLLPDGRPYYGGTYFPDEPHYNMPSFEQMLVKMADLYRERRDQVEDQATRLTAAISGRILLESDQNQHPSDDILASAFQRLAEQYDQTWGGFGTQPKFPPSMALELLLRMHHRYGWGHALNIVTHTLDRMAWGGMYDQIGGGFHRYSVDAKWLVPHFEKMLYDNALLLRVYLHGYQVTGNPLYRQVVEQTAEYVRREMTAPGGGFYSAQDADSEGEEGKFFVWTEDELHDVLGDSAEVDAVLDYWAVADGPNFEGKSILWVPDEPEAVAERHDLPVEALMRKVDKAREQLFERREGRIRPGLDDKVLTAWNGLMINSLAQAGRVLQNPAYTAMATRAADFILSEVRQNGRLLRSYKGGEARLAAYLEDYALLIDGLIELYQTTFDLRWFTTAKELTLQMIDLFWDDESGFYDTAHDHESLITRPQEVVDNAIPSGTSAAVGVLARMSILAEHSEGRRLAERVLERLGAAVAQYPTGFGYLGAHLAFMIGEPHEVALVGPLESAAMEALLATVRQPYRPFQVVAHRPPGDEKSATAIPLLAGREMVDDRATAYVCRNYTCQLPVTTPHDLHEQLERQDGATSMPSP